MLITTSVLNYYCITYLFFYFFIFDNLLNNNTHFKIRGESYDIIENNVSCDYKKIRDHKMTLIIHYLNIKIITFLIFYHLKLYGLN